MYVIVIWSCFSRGRSTPEMRAIATVSLALPLLVAGVGGADDPDHALAADHLALDANLLDRGADLHGRLRKRYLLGGAAPLAAARSRPRPRPTRHPPGKSGGL